MRVAFKKGPNFDICNNLAWVYNALGKKEKAQKYEEIAELFKQKKRFEKCANGNDAFFYASECED